MMNDGRDLQIRRSADLVNAQRMQFHTLANTYVYGVIADCAEREYG